MVLEKTLESPRDNTEIKPVNSKENQPWIFIGWTDAEVPILWLPDAESTHWERPWCWERLKAGGGGDRGWDGWSGFTDSMNMSLSKLWEMVKNRGAWHAAVHGVANRRTQLRDWTTGTSQMVQWLRFPAPNAVPWVYLVLYHLLTLPHLILPTSTLMQTGQASLSLLNSNEIQDFKKINGRLKGPRGLGTKPPHSRSGFFLLISQVASHKHVWDNEHIHTCVHHTHTHTHTYNRSKFLKRRFVPYQS